MAINSVGQYTPNYKPWDHDGVVTPVVEYSEGVRPDIFKVAPWLPVQFREKFAESWYVMLVGKVVALDNDGDVCPAQYFFTDANVTYTQDDVDAGTINVTDGAAVETGDIGSTAVSAVTAFMGRSGVAMKVSLPIGIAPYNYYQWAGGDGSNPVNFKQHNFNQQHGVTVLTDYYTEYPLVPDKETSEASGTGTKSATENIVDFAALAKLPVAANTVRTPLTFANGNASDAATRFQRQVPLRANIAIAGDWSIVLSTGVISVYKSTAGNITAGDYNVTYHHYKEAPASVSKFACAIGNLLPGDFVTFDDNSNFRLADADSVGGTTAAAPGMTGGATGTAGTNAQILRAHNMILGQVLAREVLKGKDLLDRVKTQFNPALPNTATGALPGYLGQLDQQAGSATGGVPDKINFAGAADSVVRINLQRR